MEPTRWQAWGRYVVVATGAAAISAFAFVLRAPVPGFDWIDLGVHELGHMAAAAAPRMLYFLAGSLAQVVVPLGLAAYFYFRQRDVAGTGFCLAWAGTSAWDVSVYIADAPVQALPLVGGDTHDWAYLLGPQGWDAIGSADTIARVVELTGMAAAVAGIGIAAWPAARHLLSRRAAAPAASVPLPVRQPVGSAPDPLEATPASAFSGAPSVAEDEEEPAADPWLAASQLPFFHASPRNRTS